MVVSVYSLIVVCSFLIDKLTMKLTDYNPKHCHLLTASPHASLHILEQNENIEKPNNNFNSQKSGIGAITTCANIINNSIVMERERECVCVCVVMTTELRDKHFSSTSGGQQHRWRSRTCDLKEERH